MTASSTARAKSCKPAAWWLPPRSCWPIRAWPTSMCARPPTTASCAGWSGPECQAARPWHPPRRQRRGHGRRVARHVDRAAPLTLTGLRSLGRQVVMAVRRLGIVMHGVTGRMGTNQHLIRSIAAIRADGGVLLANGDRVMPDPILVGRSHDKVASLAKAHGCCRYSSDLDACLADRNDSVFFDAASTQLRPELLAKAIAAGKHVYCEK